MIEDKRINKGSRLLSIIMQGSYLFSAQTMLFIFAERVFGPVCRIVKFTYYNRPSPRRFLCPQVTRADFKSATTWTPLCGTSFKIRSHEFLLSRSSLEIRSGWKCGSTQKNFLTPDARMNVVNFWRWQSLHCVDIWMQKIEQCTLYVD